MNHKLLPDILSSILGIILLIFILAVFLWPQNRYVLIGLFFSGGAINMVNGFRYTRSAKKKNFGMSMILLGAIILIFGCYVVLSW